MSSPADNALDRHRSEADYIDRTIATVRNHRGADNCWPQWANIFADEIEALRADRDALAARVAELEAKLASTEADYQAMYEQAADAVARVEELEAALRRIHETARWYADNDARLAHEVDHALCVEIVSYCEDAALRAEGATDA